MLITEIIKRLIEIDQELANGDREWAHISIMKLVRDLRPNYTQNTPKK